MMNFFIQAANAAETTGAAPGAHPQGGGMSMFVTFGLLFVVFYFLFIRPQNKRAKEHRNMITALAKGDEVITNGGILGRITELDDNYFGVEVAENTIIRVQKAAITANLPKGTLSKS